MDNEDKALQKRFCELSNRAYLKSYPTFSTFLNIDEQSNLMCCSLDSKFELFGGFDSAERKMACFYNREEEYKSYPIVCIEISPLIKKFADNLTHRDFLGSLMGLGIKRELLGDILISDNVGYLFCEEKIAKYICENLDKVRHTSTKCKIVDDIPSGILKEPTEKLLIVSSKRIDVLVAAVFKLSRTDTLNFFTEKRVFINNKLTENNSYQLKGNELVSVRGKGRFVFDKFLGETKKGRLKAQVKIYE